MSAASPSSRARRRAGCIIVPHPAMTRPHSISRPSQMQLRSHSRSTTSSHRQDLLSNNPLLLDTHNHYAHGVSESPSIESASPPHRHPPVDPRRSRRYCTNFGLGQNIATVSLPPSRPMYPLNDTSSGGSTPQATYASSTSSPSSSCFSFDFPQPPVSPALRRMQSSPLFTAEETDAVREFLRRRWGAQIHAKARRIVDAAEPGLAVDTKLRELDFSWYAASPTTDAGSPREQQLELELELAGEALVQAPPPCHRLQSTRSTEHMGRDGIRPLHCGRVLRRAASLAAPESPLLTFETPPPVPSLVGHSAAAPRRQHRTALSVPLAGWVPVATERPGGRRETSFMPEPILDRNVAPRSFMDLTPERDIRPRQDKNRVKKLLARASSSFAGLFGKAKK